MLDLLADLGRATIESVWLPVALWTALAALIESALRVGKSPAALALPVRGALLAALPVVLALPVLVSSLQPETAALVTEWAFVPTNWLLLAPTDGAPLAADLGPPMLDMAAGALLLLALAVGGIQSARVATALARIAWTRRCLVPATDDRQRAVADACRRLAVTRHVAVAETPHKVAPFTLGWLRPVVALPDLDASAREVAALHEVAHVARADYAWNVAQRVVMAACAAHPLVWVLGRGLDLDRERAADALVLSVCPGRRRTYADLLLSYASAPAPTLTLGAGGSSSLKHRIDAMTTPLSPSRTRLFARLGRSIAALAIISMAGLAATTAPRPSGADQSTLQQTERVQGISARDTTDIVDIADVQPELIGGMQALIDRIEYPELQRRAGIEGRAIVQFVVDTDGSVADARVVRSAGDDALDQAALAAVEGLEFTPALVDDAPVRVRFAVPIVFSLAGADDASDAEARAARYPDARLAMSGIDLGLFRDADLVSAMLVANGQILRESHPALPDGTTAEISFEVGADGRIVDDIRIAVETQPDDSDRGLANLSRALVGLIQTPAPELSGQTVTFTTTYVRGD